MNIGIGMAVRRSTHEVFVFNDKGEVVEKRFVSNCRQGLGNVLDLLRENGNGRTVAFAGNRRWATPFAYGLDAMGITPLYYSFRSEGERGPVGNFGKLLAQAVKSGAKPREFFQRPPHDGNLLPEIPTSYRLAEEYLSATNDVRQAKHRLLDTLAILFPEVVPSEKKEQGTGEKKISLPVPKPEPPDLFTKKMRPFLERPDPEWILSEEEFPKWIRTLAGKSLARYIPFDVRKQVAENHAKNLEEFYRKNDLKSAKLAEMRQMAALHPLFLAFGQGDIGAVLTCLLGWRKWPRWRELRHYAGLAVSRLDSKGNPRISRVRPPIRQYLYLYMTLNKDGRTMVADLKGKKRVKKIERVLKRMWQGALKSSEVTV